MTRSQNTLYGGALDVGVAVTDIQLPNAAPRVITVQGDAGGGLLLLPRLNGLFRRPGFPQFIVFNTDPTESIILNPHPDDVGSSWFQFCAAQRCIQVGMYVKPDGTREWMSSNAITFQT